MSIFSKNFRPISDHSGPLLKCPKTKGFATFGAKFSDLKRVGRFPAIILQNAPQFSIFALFSDNNSALHIVKTIAPMAQQ